MPSTGHQPRTMMVCGGEGREEEEERDKGNVSKEKHIRELEI